MKPTDFSVHVTTFLTHYLAAQRNVSPNTIKAYRDVFTIFLRFCRDVQGIDPERLRLEQIDVSVVEAFLDYLERERRSAPTTRNHRLAAPARILPISSVRRAGPHASVPKNPCHSPAATRSSDGWLSFQRGLG
jgi:Phage integrase, N-terminal SAM-like domain